MSTENQPALPDVPTAQATIAQRVHIAAFMDKLAAIRPQYVPQNQEQLSELLQIGADLQAAEMAQKQAAPTTSPFGQALAGLRNVLHGSGLDGGIKAAAQRDEQARLTRIGAALAADPEIYAATVAIKLAQAQAAA